MQKTSKMPSWQIFPDAGNTYRWVISGQGPTSKPELDSRKTLIHHENPTSRLPSMEDLLIQGSSKLFQNSGSTYDEKASMFRTGSGKSVEVKKSSIMKAMSVLEDENFTNRAPSKICYDEKSPMFRTGSGKSVQVKQSSIMKAESVLGDENFTIRGSSKVSQISGSTTTERSGMFRTGLGKSVEVNKSSVTKALSVLGEDGATVLGEDGVTIRGQINATHNGGSFSNSLFQTGSGKMVNFSSAGLSRAKTLLGLEDSSDQFIANESNGWEKSPNLEKRGSGDINGTVNVRSISGHPVNGQTDTTGCESREFLPALQSSEVRKSTGMPPPVKFQTAGGRSISVSNDAFQRAMSLLGDSEFGCLPNKGGADAPPFPFLQENSSSGTSLNKENDIFASCLQHESAKRKSTLKSFLPPKAPIFKENQGSTTVGAFSSGKNSLKPVRENDSLHEEHHRPDYSICFKVDTLRSEPLNPVMPVENSLVKNIAPRTNPLGRSSGGALVDISNNIGSTYADQKQIPREKRRLTKRSSVSPFKKPRCSRFSTPLTNSVPKGSSTLTCGQSSCKEKIFARYPFQIARATVKDFFGGPPCHKNRLEHVPPEVKSMNAETAEIYMFHDASHLDGIEAEGFRHMLSQSGASMQYATRDWVANHYKWIVWKLACYERCYPTKATGKYLNLVNVLEELKYRYEREVNHAHRSALKRILEGDASPASMVVLCISAIRFNPDENLELERAMALYEDANKCSGSKMIEKSNNVKIELTDGWYAIDAILDGPLSKQLVAGKLYVGQKLRIWRACLSGWAGPISPLEPSKTASLQLHINGTYRVHWAERLGLCRYPGPPLAFGCIKSRGGLVPKTLVGVTRIYPILYKERLTDSGSVVRTERMERKMLQEYNQKRSTIAEGIMSEFQKDVSSFHFKNENDSEEGAKILKLLEKSAEPEIIMAQMSLKQLNSFANYQAKQEEIRQSDMDKKIEKALEDAGLSERHITPFMRARVVGLTSNRTPSKGCPGEGLITIWNPTEKQQLELVEGKAYTVTGLIPLNSDSETIYLHARGSTTTWQTLPPLAIASFKPFFTPRKPVHLSNIGEVPLASEFDIASLILHVGEVYLSGHQKKQWVFVTDWSISVSELDSKEASNCLLAICFCTSNVDNDSFAPISYTLVGSTIGFLNLVKRARDPINHIWVAEATDNSTYSCSYDIPGYSHLKEAATSACNWAKISSLAIQKLKEKILFIVGNHKR